MSANSGTTSSQEIHGSWWPGAALRARRRSYQTVATAATISTTPAPISSGRSPALT